MLQIYNTKNSELIQKNDDYTIKSLYLKGVDGTIDWTINFFYINPHKQCKVITIPATTPGSKNRAFYQVMSNNVFFVINEKTTILNKGQLFVVNQGLRHYFFNPNDYQSVVIMNYPGNLKFQKKVDTVDDLIPKVEKSRFQELDPYSLPSS